MKERRSASHGQLPFFVSGFPDETIASRISRYHLLRGNAKASDTFGELFESGPFNIGHWIPQNLNVLASKLPGVPSINLETLHGDGTLLTLFRIFGITSKQHKHGHAFEANERLPRRIVGESGSTHVCLSCSAADEQAKGVPYIHRAHQIPGVTACWLHGTKTIDRCPFCNCPLESPKGLILTPWLACACGRRLEEMMSYEMLAEPIEISFAQFAYSLLNRTDFHPQQDRVVAAYRERVIELGYGKGKMRIDRKALMAAITSFYGGSQLHKMDYALRTERCDNWLRILYSAHAKDVPLNRHMLLAFFLFKDAKTFLSAVENAKPLQRQRAAHCSGGKANKSSDAKLNEKGLSDNDETIEALAQLAMEQGNGIDGLWATRFGTMRRLVSKNPDIVGLLQRRIDLLAHPENRGASDSSGGNSKATRNSELDRQLAETVGKMSVNFYLKADKPVMATMNQLIKASGIRLSSWPSKLDFPLTREQLETCSESQWHFYARRIVWALLHFPPRMYKESTFLKMAGLEWHKGVAALRHLEPIVQRSPLKPGVIMHILERLGIGKDWEGPCPGRKFVSANISRMKPQTK